MASGIYSITINDKIYIGSAVDFRKRWALHRHYLKTNKHKNPCLQNAWNCYQESVFEIICECPRACLLGMEQYYISKFFDNQVNCYNINPIAGSGLGHKMSEGNRLRLVERNKGNSYAKGHQNALGYKHTNEAKEKIAEAGVGRQHTEESKKKMSHSCSDKTKKLISESRIGYKHSDETREKLFGNKNCLGRKLSKETIQKISEGNKGRAVSEETRKRMSEAKKGRKQAEDTVRKRVESRKKTMKIASEIRGLTK